MEGRKGWCYPNCEEKKTPGPFLDSKSAICLRWEFGVFWLKVVGLTVSTGIGCVRICQWWDWASLGGLHPPAFLSLMTTAWQVCFWWALGLSLLTFPLVLPSPPFWYTHWLSCLHLSPFLLVGLLFVGVSSSLSSQQITVVHFLLICEYWAFIGAADSWFSGVPKLLVALCIPYQSF